MTGLLTRSTIVVVTWRGKGHVGACLDAVAAQTRPHRLLVVDNASDDGTAEVLARHPSAPSVVRLPANVGYAGALAEVEVDTEFMAWLNDDAEPAPDWLESLEDALDQRKDAAAASSRMITTDGAVLSVGVGLTADGHGVDLGAGTSVFGFCGGAALLRTDALRRVGGVPARFFCYYEDTDTAWRLRLAGHTIVSVPNAVVTHRHGASSQLGSRQFHLWNERNRLAMLIRCAPAGVATREVTRFAAITAMLPLRRLAGRSRAGLALRGLAGRSRAGLALRGLAGGAWVSLALRRARALLRRPVDNRPLAGRNCRWPRVAWNPGDPPGHEGTVRSGSSSASSEQPADVGRDCRCSPVGWNSGDPQGHERAVRSGSSSASSEQPADAAQNCRCSSLDSKSGGPRGHEGTVRSGSSSASSEQPADAALDCRCSSVSSNPGDPLGHERAVRSGSSSASSEQPADAGQDCRCSSLDSKPGDPQAYERDFRSGSVGEPVASGRSWAVIRRSSLVAWVRGPEAEPPWNFRIGLRLRVLRELVTTLGPLLRERRTVTRLAHVPRSVVWRGGRSTNSSR